MDEILLFIVLGLGSGALIAGISLGVVLTYRGSGIINLSVGAMAMLGGYAFWALTSGKIASLPTGAALPLALLFVVACGALVEFAVFRPLRNSSPLSKMVSSLGVLLIAQSAMLLAFGTTPQPEPTILPTTGFMLFGSNIGWDIIILAVLILVITAALWAVYKWTRFGLATRAASENEAAAMLGGLNPVRIGLANNLLSSLLAGLLGILAAAITQLDPSTLPLQIIPALAAALIAGFTSFWTATISAFVISIVYSLIDYMAAQSWFPQSGGVALPGTTDLLAFLIIIGVLFWRGTRIPGRGELVERRLPEAPRPQHLWRTALICAVFGAILLIVFPFDFRQALINTLIGAVMALSLVVITGYVGQISVIQLSLAGAAGFTVSHMAVNFGITFPARRPGRHRGRGGDRRHHRRLRGQGPRRVPRRRHPGRRGRDRELRLHQHHLGRRLDRLPGARAEVLRPRPRLQRTGSTASTGTCRRRSSASSAWPAASCSPSGSGSSGAAGSASRCSPSAPTSAPRPPPRSTRAR